MQKMKTQSDAVACLWANPHRLQEGVGCRTSRWPTGSGPFIMGLPVTTSSDSPILTCQNLRSLSNFARTHHWPMRSLLVSWKNASGLAFFLSASVQVGLIGRHMSSTILQSVRGKWDLGSFRSAYTSPTSSEPDSRLEAVLNSIGSCALKKDLPLGDCSNIILSSSTSKLFVQWWSEWKKHLFWASPSRYVTVPDHEDEGSDRDPPTVSNSGQPIQYRPPSAAPILGANAPTISALMKVRKW